MVRGIAELEEILEEIQKKVFLANRLDKLDDLLLKWGITQSLEESSIVDDKPKYGKIAIIGNSEIKENAVCEIFESFGISKDRLELCLDYELAQRYNYRKMHCNSAYSLILFGPVPHSAKEKGDSESIISSLEKDANYPPVVRILCSNGLKVTKSSLKKTISDILEKDIIRADTQ